ncbi:MAG: hypothetical protein AAGM67_18625, partial [Bacteroidota bacterium]
IDDEEMDIGDVGFMFPIEGGWLTYNYWKDSLVDHMITGNYPIRLILGVYPNIKAAAEAVVAARPEGI